MGGSSYGRSQLGSGEALIKHGIQQPLGTTCRGKVKASPTLNFYARSLLSPGTLKEELNGQLNVPVISGPR